MNVKEVLGAFSLVNNPIVLSEEEVKDVQKAIKELQQENKKLNGAIQTYDILLKTNVEENKQLKEQVQDLKADYGTIAQIERDLYKEVIEEVREYINSKVISNGEIIDQLRKIEVKELLQILDKAKDSDD